MSGVSSGDEFQTLLSGRRGVASSSSFCYSNTSGSSTSSSVENISTSSSIENGDQITITFVPKEPQTDFLGSFLDEVFSIDTIFPEEARLGLPCNNKAFGDSHPPSLPQARSSAVSLWDDSTDVENSFSAMYNSMTSSDERPSSVSSSNSKAIQHLCGDGLLLKSLEKGAPFPYLHLSTSGFCVPPSAILQERPDVKQGIYKEIKRVVPPDSWIKMDDHEDHSKSTWLFLGYKTLDKNNEVLEQSWKEWTGVRHLYLELRTDIHIRRISFFRRRDPLDSWDAFTYVAFIEIGAISGKTHRWLLDFVQRARLERMQSTMTVYEEIELWEGDSGVP